MTSKSIAAIVVAAGRGERAAAGGALPKQYRPVAGIPVLVRAIRALLEVPSVGWILPVIHPEHVPFYESLQLDDARLLPPVAGGANADGTGVLRVVATDGIAEAVASVAPGLVVEQVTLTGGLATSSSLRAAGWAEASVLLAAATGATSSMTTSPACAPAASRSLRSTLSQWPPWPSGSSVA